MPLAPTLIRPAGLGDVERALTAAVGSQPVRARSLNLIVVGPGAAEPAAEVVRRHPARVVALDLRPGNADGLEADVRVEGHLELIVLRAGGGPAAHPAALAVPLLAADLPTFLWWPGDWPPDPGLVEACDRVIVDSRAFRDRAAAFRDLARLARSRGTGCAAGDLEWTRLLPWRQRIAREFDDAERRERLSGVRLAYAGSPAQAWLLAGWLRSRLGRPLAVELREAAADGEPGLVAAEVGDVTLRGPVGPAAGTGALLAVECDVLCDPVYEAALRDAAGSFAGEEGVH